MVLTEARSRLMRRAALVSLLAAVPTLLIPSPFAHRHFDPLQAVAVGSARDAVTETRDDRWGIARALIAPFKHVLHPAAEKPAASDSTVTAYAATPDTLDPIGKIDPASALGIDLAALREGIDAYRRGDVAAGDAIATRSTDALFATVLAWTWLKTHPREAGTGRLSQFIADHPDWPGNDWLRRRVEDALYGDRTSPTKIKAWFASQPPLTTLGRIAFARALRDSGDVTGATKLIREIWAREDLSPFAETALRKQFGDLLTVADHKLRADRLMYDEKDAAALRVATLSGDKDLLALEKVRAAAQNGPLSDKLLATLPARYADDPGIRFAKIQIARRANKIEDAATLMLAAPRDPAVIVDGDEWWVERRLVARKLLDIGQSEKAYQICAQHSASSYESRLEAEFHAGWIALRFLNDPARAKPHFASLAELARTPMSKARAAYWQGRAAEAAREPANTFYAAAASFPTTWYGQLAASREGGKLPAPAIIPAAEGNARNEAVRAVDALYLAGAKDLAVALAADVARNVREPEQVKALAQIVARDRDAKVSLSIGKLASQRGVTIDALAFPTYGIPDFSPLPNSASLPLVYAIARQESAFDPNALSSAGAMGLMQMIASTARRTAQRAGLVFNELRMRADPTFNAQLGAAHLGELLGEHGNSTILTLVAYNAGGKRAKEWIDAYGDPRRAEPDAVVDWIERIPFTETRNYVQRVSENLAVYKAQLATVVKPAAVTASASPSLAPAPATGSEPTSTASAAILQQVGAR